MKTPRMFSRLAVTSIQREKEKNTPQLADNVADLSRAQTKYETVS